MGTTTNGNAVQVALIDFSVAVPYAATSEATDFQLSDRAMNPLDPFSASASRETGAGVVILNGSTSPMTLVDMYVDKGGKQLSYPATKDPKTQKMVREHQIPATRYYPWKYKHVDSAGVPLRLFGLGVYRFDSCGPSDWATQLAMKFSCKKDLSGPFLGIAFKCRRNEPVFALPYNDGESAVSADVDGIYGDVKTFYNNTVDAGKYSSAAGSSSDPVSIWATFQDHVTVAHSETGMLALKVWTRQNT